MIKRIFALCLLTILVLTPLAFADTARMGSFASGLEGVMGLGDVSSGTAVEVTSVGGLAATQKAVAVGDAITSAAIGQDTLIYTGACNVLGVLITGETIGDWAAIYDNTSATTATLKFDPRIAANTSSFYFDANGAPFATGIYVNVLDSEVLATVVYDY